MEEHCLAPSAFKGKCLYCAPNSLLCLVRVLQVSLMSVGAALSLSCPVFVEVVVNYWVGRLNQVFHVPFGL